MVVLSGCPCSPNISQKHTGNPCGTWFVSPSSWIRSTTFLLVPEDGLEIPERSPLISDMITGTPMLLKVSASVCRVTVLPVPVAPAISPCRFDILGIRKRSLSDLAISRFPFGSIMVVCFVVKIIKRYQVSGIRYQVSGIRDQGSGTRDQGSADTQSLIPDTS